MKTFYVESDILEIIKNIKNEIKLINNKKILLLGSNGFLGKYFVKIFDQIISEKKARFSVDCFDNYISSSSSNRTTIKNKEKIKFYKADVSTHTFKKKYDVIIFLAGIASPFIYKKNPIKTLSVSYDGVSNLIAKAKKNKSRFVFFSSSEIYGNPDEKNLPTKEAYYGNVNSFGPRSCYDEGKRVGETLCYIYNVYHNTDVKVIRPFNVFGPLMDKNDYRIVPNIIKKINTKKKILIHGDGKQTRTFCYVTDAITAMFLVIIKGNKFVYNIGNDKPEINMSMLHKSIEKSIQKKINHKNIDYPKNYPQVEPLRRCPNISKIKEELGFKNNVGLLDSIRRFYFWTKKYY